MKKVLIFIKKIVWNKYIACAIFLFLGMGMGYNSTCEPPKTVTVEKPVEIIREVEKPIETVKEVEVVKEVGKTPQACKELIEVDDAIFGATADAFENFSNTYDYAYLGDLGDYIASKTDQRAKAKTDCLAS